MPYYRCTIANISGKKQDILVRAGNTAELLEAYAGGDNFLLSYMEEKDPSPRQAGRGFFRGHIHFSRNLILEFTDIMAALLTAGNTLPGSLELCRAMGGSDSKLSRLCGLLVEGIRKGERFSEALLRGGSSFSSLYEAMMRIGEKTGRMADVFKRLTVYLKTEKRIRTKVHSALFYPVCVLVSALAGAVLVLLFVMPRMAEIFAAFTVETGGDMAEHIAGMYTSVYAVTAVLAGVVFTAIVILLLYRRSAKAALVLDRMALRLPFMGAFITALESLDFCFTMELCSSAGMNAAVSLEAARKVARNRAYARAVAELREEVLAGNQLSRAFLERPVFPPIMGRWLAVGERTGEAGMVFMYIKTFFEETVDTAVERFLSGLEPLLIVITGLIVLGLIVQFVMPLFDLYGVVI
jgi:type II secretory pathway component PulF